MLIELTDLRFAYPGRDTVLKNLSFSLCRGQRLGLSGPNGSGKSTLMHLVMGLIKPQNGSIKLFGETVASEKDFQKVRHRIGFVFQHADDQLFSPTVLEDVAFGPLNMGKSPQEAVEMSRQALTALGLDGFEDRVTHKLSGGEKKLVSFATVLVMKPEFLLLDEPTTGLDERTVERMVTVLTDLDIGYVAVSHERAFLNRICAETYRMNAGRIERSDNAHALPGAAPEKVPG